MERFKAVEGSESSHCCFEATVMLGEETICECFSMEDAKRVADALNAAESRN
jgi:hypothetical protein